MDDHDEVVSTLSRTRKGRRIFDSDPSLTKLHDSQLEVVKKCSNVKEKPKSPTQTLEKNLTSQSHKNFPIANSVKTAVPIKSVPLLNPHARTQNKSGEEAEIFNTPFLDELKLYMTQSKHSAEAISDTQSTVSVYVYPAGHLSGSNIDTVKTGVSNTKMQRNFIKSVQSHLYEPQSESDSEAESDDESSDSHVSSHNGPVTPKKLVSKVFGGNAVSTDEKNQAINESVVCLASKSMHHLNSDSENSSLSNQSPSVDSPLNTSESTEKLKALAVAEFTMMAKTLPKLRGDQKRESLTKQIEGTHNDVHLAYSFRKEISKTDVVDIIESLGDTSKNDRALSDSKKESISSENSDTMKYDRTTLKISNLNPEEMPSALLKTMVEGVVAVTEPEFEPHSNFRTPTRSLYILFKSEFAAEKALEFFENSNFHCNYRSYE